MSNGIKFEQWKGLIEAQGNRNEMAQVLDGVQIDREQVESDKLRYNAIMSKALQKMGAGELANLIGDKLNQIEPTETKQSTDAQKACNNRSYSLQNMD